MHKKIAVIGASSKTGQALLNLLGSSDFYKVFAFSLNKDLKSFFTFEEQIELTPLQFKDFKKKIYSIEPDVIINTAGINDFAECEQNKTLCNDVNVKFVENLARTTKILDSKIIQISSDKIFSGADGPYDESSRPGPSTYFGKTKLAAENHIMSAVENFAIIRVSSIFGNTVFNKSDIVNNIIEKTINGKNIHLADDYFLNPINTGDLARIILQILGKNSTGIYHAGNSDIISMFDFGLMVAEVFDCDRTLISSKNGDVNDFKGHYGVITLKTETALGIKLPENRDSLLFHRNTKNIYKRSK